MDHTRHTLKVFTACGPENGSVLVTELMERFKELHMSTPPTDLLAFCNARQDGRIGFLHYWVAMDKFFAECRVADSRGEPDPSADLVREMETFRNEILNLEDRYQVVPTAELERILDALRAESHDPAYWEEVASQLPPGGSLEFSELAEALYVWLSEFEDEWGSMPGSAKGKRMSSTPRLTPRLTPRASFRQEMQTTPVSGHNRRTPLREITNQAKGPESGEAKNTTLQATSSTSTGGTVANLRTSVASRPSLAQEIRDAEERVRREEVLATPKWRDRDPETPSTWRSKLEADIHSLRTEVEAKHDDVLKLQSDCAALGRALGSIAPTVGLTPRTRKCLQRAQSLGEKTFEQRGSLESPTTLRCSELEREMHTLEVQKVSSDEEIRRLADLVNAQKEELALLKGRAGELEKIHESCPSETGADSDDDSCCYSPRDSSRDCSNVPQRGVPVGGLTAQSMSGVDKEKKAKKAKKEKKEKKRFCVEDELPKEKKKKKKTRSKADAEMCTIS
jgi:hypothetical protein